MGASDSGKKADAAHAPVSASTNDALTELLPTSKPKRYLPDIKNNVIGLWVSAVVFHVAFHPHIFGKINAFFPYLSEKYC
jgi:hypothetical protein